MELSTIVEKAQGLGDVELAILLCLMAREHCILRTDHARLASLRNEVQVVCAGIYSIRRIAELRNRCLQLCLGFLIQSFAAVNQ